MEAILFWASVAVIIWVWYKCKGSRNQPIGRPPTQAPRKSKTEMLEQEIEHQRFVKVANLILSETSEQGPITWDDPDDEAMDTLIRLSVVGSMSFDSDFLTRIKESANPGEALYEYYKDRHEEANRPKTPEEQRKLDEQMLHLYLSPKILQKDAALERWEEIYCLVDEYQEKLSAGCGFR